MVQGIEAGITASTLAGPLGVAVLVIVMVLVGLAVCIRLAVLVLVAVKVCVGMRVFVKVGVGVFVAVGLIVKVEDGIGAVMLNGSKVDCWIFDEQAVMNTINIKIKRSFNFKYFLYSPNTFRIFIQ